MCGSLATTLGAFALGYGLGHNRYADTPRHKRLSVVPTAGGLAMSF